MNQLTPFQLAVLTRLEQIAHTSYTGKPMAGEEARYSAYSNWVICRDFLKQREPADPAAFKPRIEEKIHGFNTVHYPTCPICRSLKSVRATRAPGADYPFTCLACGIVWYFPDPPAEALPAEPFGTIEAATKPA